MKYTSATVAKNTLFLLFFIFISCNSCSNDDFANPITQEDQKVTLAEVEVLESSTQNLTENSAPIEVLENEESSNQVICETSGGKADEVGLKTWCWKDINLPSGEPGNNNFSNGELVVATECNPGQVTKVDDRLRFYLNPTYPEPKSWCSNSFNMRAEFRTAPWKVDHPIGTEEWFGWSYTFGDDYVIDQETPWAFFQVHEGTVGKTPMIALWCTTDGGPGGGNGGEIIVSNTTGGGETYASTGVIPKAGQTIDMVIRVVWGDGSNGELQIWIDGNLVHDVKRRTVHSFNPVGGNAKFGIYKWPWRDGSGVQKSAEQGITHLETFMGPLRMITRRPGDPDYGKNSFQEVSPN